MRFARSASLAFSALGDPRLAYSRCSKWPLGRFQLARASTASSSTCAPRATCSRVEYSRGLCVMPLTLGRTASRWGRAARSEPNHGRPPRSCRGWRAAAPRPCRAAGRRARGRTRSARTSRRDRPRSALACGPRCHPARCAASASMARALGRDLMPHVAVQAGDVGDIAARVREVLDPGGRGAALRLGRQRDALHRQDGLRRCGQAVAAAIHRGGTDMAGLAGHGQLEVTRVHGAGDDADIGAGRLHDRALLDMRLQPAGPAARRRRQRAGLAASRSACATLTPASSVMASASSSVMSPACTRLPIIAGRKRLPSSLVQFTSSSGARVRCRRHPARASLPGRPARRTRRRNVRRSARYRDGCRRRPPARRRRCPRGAGTCCRSRPARNAGPAACTSRSNRRACRGVLGRQRQAATAAFRRRADRGDLHDGLPQAVGVDRGGHAGLLRWWGATIWARAARGYARAGRVLDQS